MVASQQIGTAGSRLAERVMLTLEPSKQLSHRVPVCEKLLWYGDYFMAMETFAEEGRPNM